MKFKAVQKTFNGLYPEGCSLATQSSVLAVSGMLLCFFTATSLRAASISLSLSDPNVNGADIALLPGSTTTSNPNNDTSAIWSDRPDQGQTFTTGENSGGYVMNGFGFLHQFSSGWDINTLNLTVGAISGATFTPAVSETILPANTPTVTGAPTWYNFVLGTPLSLNANTTYAVFVGNPDGNGAVFMQSTSDADYLGGTAFRDTLANGVFDNPVIGHGFDRIFHIDLVATVPESSSFALVALGFGVMASRRRRH